MRPNSQVRFRLVSLSVRVAHCLLFTADSDRVHCLLFTADSDRVHCLHGLCV
jgi:hypothetical protein